MAKVELAYPVEKLQGKVDKEGKVYYCNRLGETVASHYPLRKDPKKISPLQRACFDTFQAAVRQAQAELSDPARRAYWQDLFDRQPAPARYRVLRNFVIASLTKK